MTTVGQAGSPVGLQTQACTIVTALKAMDYSHGQFGKNHLGDLYEFLPVLGEKGADSFRRLRWRAQDPA